MTKKDEKWQSMKTAPTDDSQFLVGRFWFQTFEQTISHHENPNGPYPDRGWNHRNGPFGGRATLWRRLPPGPKITHWMDDRGFFVSEEWLMQDPDSTSDYRAAYYIPCVERNCRIVPFDPLVSIPTKD